MCFVIDYLTVKSISLPVTLNILSNERSRSPITLITILKTGSVKSLYYIWIVILYDLFRWIREKVDRILRWVGHATYLYVSTGFFRIVHLIDCWTAFKLHSGTYFTREKMGISGSVLAFDRPCIINSWRKAWLGTTHYLSKFSLQVNRSSEHIF